MKNLRIEKAQIKKEAEALLKRMVQRLLEQGFKPELIKERLFERLEKEHPEFLNILTCN